MRRLSSEQQCCRDFVNNGYLSILQQHSRISIGCQAYSADCAGTSEFFQIFSRN